MSLIEYRGNTYTVDQFNDYIPHFLCDWSEQASTEEVMNIIGAEYISEHDARENYLLNKADDEYGMER